MHVDSRPGLSGTAPAAGGRDAGLNLRDGKLVPVLEAAEAVLGFRVSPATHWRHAAKGVRVEVAAPDGTVEVRRVRLPTVKVAGRRCTTVEAYRAFVEATNPDLAAGGMCDRGTVSDDTDAALRAAGLLPD